MPESVFLTKPEQLAGKVARWLAGNLSSRPIDLSRLIVVLPTAGAARRLRAELARAAAVAGTGVLPPQFTTPMGLLGLNAAETIARRSECLLAWADAISRTSPEKSPLLLAGFSDLKRSALRIGQSLMEVCSLLAEAGLTPSSPEIFRACPQDEDRWREIEALICSAEGVGEGLLLWRVVLKSGLGWKEVWEQSLWAKWMCCESILLVLHRLAPMKPTKDGGWVWE